jgi:hypothetical protein
VPTRVKAGVVTWWWLHQRLQQHSSQQRQNEEAFAVVEEKDAMWIRFIRVNIGSTGATATQWREILQV